MRRIEISRYRAVVPELLEVESYRRHATSTVGRRIVGVDLPDPEYWRGDVPPEVLIGGRVRAVRRIGKLMLLDTDQVTLGLRFGMTGRLLVDGSSSIDQLEYASRRDLPEWVRVAIHFDGGGAMAISDPRRLGWVEIDPDENRLGPDAATLGLAGLRRILAESNAALKARLMDQQRLAGLGNLLTDEILWRAGLDPRRPAKSLTDPEVRRLHRHLRRVIDELGTRGGSQMGDLQTFRVLGARCPRDGESLRRDTIGGRSTWWCPVHQS